ncbi:hypothetical protein BKA56DRAFT_679840 [Ilyonectria sp. MPI-CAGE-AT-0026]|nr:hypothetical protein BKA56DRAFT_679840 [Ilyonectria sp. MPI-CAGE-AT-0026]
MAAPQASTQRLLSSLQSGERSSPAQVHLMGTYCGSFQSGPDYCQPETVDPTLTLLSTTSRVFEGTEGVSSSRLDEGRHLAAGTADLLAEWWELGLQEYTCEGCPLEDSSGSVVHFPSHDDLKTTMAPPYQTSAIYYIHPEQQCQCGVPCLTNETGHNGGSADVISQQWGFTGPIADFTNDGLEADAPTIMMPSDPFLLFYGEDLVESFERGQSYGRAPPVATTNIEDPLISDNRGTTYDKPNQSVDPTILSGASENTEDRPQRQCSSIKENARYAKSKPAQKCSARALRSRNRIKTVKEKGKPFRKGDACLNIWELVHGKAGEDNK